MAESIAKVPGIRGVVLVNPEGLLLARAGIEVEAEDQDILAGALASAMGFGGTIAQQLGIGPFMMRGLIEAERGVVVFASLRGVAEGYTLAVLADPDIMLGILFSLVKSLRERLENLLTELEAVR